MLSTFRIVFHPLHRLPTEVSICAHHHTLSNNTLTQQHSQALHQTDEFLRSKYGVVKLDLDDTVTEWEDIASELAKKLEVSRRTIKIFKLVPREVYNTHNNNKGQKGGTTTDTFPNDATALTLRGWQYLNCDVEEINCTREKDNETTTLNASTDDVGEGGETKLPLPQTVELVNLARGRNRLDKIVLWYKLV